MGTVDTIETENLRITVKEKSNGNITVSFDGEMTIYSVSEIEKVLMEKMENTDIIEAEMSGVSRIDTSVFQLLLLARREAEDNSKTVSIVNPSEETSRIFNLYGESL